MGKQILQIAIEKKSNFRRKSDSLHIVSSNIAVFECLQFDSNVQ